ncbi:MAG: hypothetical protein KDK39_15335 [Leptospiraceae bacterium]|nr:hypothetical protein [Leptospiraceae bacterium]
MLSTCEEQRDETALIALELAYLARSAPSISCYYTAKSGTEYCRQNPSVADQLATICQYGPLFDSESPDKTYYSNQSCETLGFSNCSTTTAVLISHQKCTK